MNLAGEAAPFLFIIAGEPSGDALGGALIAALKVNVGLSLVGVVVGEFQSRITSKQTGKQITTSNILVLRVRGGRIVSSRDYHNHARLAEFIGPPRPQRDPHRQGPPTLSNAVGRQPGDTRAAHGRLRAGRSGRFR